ncbi:uncharacterized protein SPAPADRAFT_58419 [Spathaspora passalidarum NRRL Y-27907]|uniref:Uncharacterized protein n=1 Tax=Spathaspora passalidarum (strain NRRL Y-27907 / 11-Y1) TaxID=619300 RepID=G3AG81_SPAPN|nr:uncharacterized protein SPAPADRAFT_58419 [Spathaspora passalidarum NRRL Y-27907]EGW35220.1 hypothetical protein SPAPADRAFT_58419 [Spathaspora passalidarum NRRL Y-27907]
MYNFQCDLNLFTFSPTPPCVNIICIHRLNLCIYYNMIRVLLVTWKPTYKIA